MSNCGRCGAALDSYPTFTVHVDEHTVLRLCSRGCMLDTIDDEAHHRPWYSEGQYNYEETDNE